MFVPDAAQTNQGVPEGPINFLSFPYGSSNRLFLVNCYQLHILLNYVLLASKVGGLVIHLNCVGLA